MRKMLLLVPLVILCISEGSAQPGAFIHWPVFEGGNMRMQISMRGQIGSSFYQNEGGLLWPMDGVSSRVSRTLCYSSTPVLTGWIYEDLRVAASYQSNSFLPGPIVQGKPPADPTDPLFRAYSLTQGRTTEQDYQDWPASFGAPVLPSGEPQFYGPRQIFWLLNDLDTAAMSLNNGCLPLGLEMRCLLYEPWSGYGKREYAPAADNLYQPGLGTYRRCAPRLHTWIWRYVMPTELAGTDSLRGMAYAFTTRDTYRNNGMPAAFGLVMLQTPVLARAPVKSALE
jgi:hypothetical protein